MKSAIFYQQNYRDFLQESLEHRGGRGQRAALAEHLRCQNSFISQVLTERAHLSLEHGIATAEFLRLNSEETKFFLLLLQRDKAGSARLRQYFQEQIDETRAQTAMVKAHLNIKDELNEEDQATYYSMWWYAAVHILSALPGTQTRPAIAERLQLPTTIVDRALLFLSARSLVVEKDGRLGIGKGRVHLGDKSPLIARHHVNWRSKTAHFLESHGAQNPKHLHYSGILGLSRSDAKKIQRILLGALSETESLLEKSPEEAPFCLAIDWYEI